MAEVVDIMDLSKIHIDEKLVNPCPKSEVDARLEKTQKALKDALEAVGGSVVSWKALEDTSNASQRRMTFEATLMFPSNPDSDPNWQTKLRQKINNLGQTETGMGKARSMLPIRLKGNFLIEEL